MKPLFKEILFVIGGPHVTALPEEAIQYADVVVRGEAEYTIVDLVKAIEKGDDYKNLDGISFMHKGKIVHNKARALIKNLDEIPYPARHLLPMKKYHFMGEKGITITNIMMSRGCPYHCNYCNKNIFGYSIRGRSVENIMGEIDELVNKFNINEIHISDDCFNYDRKKIMLFCEEMKKAKYDLSFFPHAGIRVHSSDLEQFKALKKIGFYAMAFGVESGNQQILNNIKKGITLQQARDAFKLAHKAEFDEVWGYFMLGLKGETLQTAKETIKFAIELDPTIAKFHIAVPYPGTEYYNELKVQNRLRIRKWFDYAIYSEPVFVPENMSVQQLIDVHKESYRKFFLRPKTVFRAVKMGFKNPRKTFGYAKAGLNLIGMSK